MFFHPKKYHRISGIEFNIKYGPWALVVGASRKHGVDANSIDPKDFPPGTSLPRLPEAVAEAMFPQLGAGPRLYSRPDDAAPAERAARRARAEVGRTVYRLKPELI